MSFQVLPVDSRGNGEARITLPAVAAGAMRPVYCQFGHTAPTSNALGMLFCDYLKVAEASQN